MHRGYKRVEGSEILISIQAESVKTAGIVDEYSEAFHKSLGVT